MNARLILKNSICFKSLFSYNQTLQGFTSRISLLEGGSTPSNRKIGHKTSLHQIFTPLDQRLSVVLSIKKSLFVRFPPSDKKKPSTKIPHPPYLLMWKTLILILIEDEINL